MYEHLIGFQINIDVHLSLWELWIFILKTTWFSVLDCTPFFGAESELYFCLWDENTANLNKNILSVIGMLIFFLASECHVGMIIINACKPWMGCLNWIHVNISVTSCGPQYIYILLLFFWCCFHFTVVILLD